jgi:hypothetical protein
MTPFLEKIIRAGATIATALARVRERIGTAFLSKPGNARRAFGRSEALKREEMEAERIDRLRHPSDYQGR